MFPVLRWPLIFTHMILILHRQHALCGFPVQTWGFLRRNIRSSCLRYQRSACTHDQEGHRQGRQSRGDTRFIQGVCSSLLTASLLLPCLPTPSPPPAAPVWSPCSSQRSGLQEKLAHIILLLRTIQTSPDCQE